MIYWRKLYQILSIQSKFWLQGSFSIIYELSSKSAKIGLEDTKTPS